MRDCADARSRQYISYFAFSAPVTPAKRSRVSQILPCFYPVSVSILLYWPSRTLLQGYFLNLDRFIQRAARFPAAEIFLYCRGCRGSDVLVLGCQAVPEISFVFVTSKGRQHEAGADRRHQKAFDSTASAALSG